MGDLSYADSLETRWDSWQTLIQYVSSRVPWQVRERRIFFRRSSDSSHYTFQLVNR